jgi:hypothetical protein
MKCSPGWHELLAPPESYKVPEQVVMIEFSLIRYVCAKIGVHPIIDNKIENTRVFICTIYANKYKRELLKRHINIRFSCIAITKSLNIYLKQTNFLVSQRVVWHEIIVINRKIYVKFVEIK